jgi:hypothetical protein
MDEDRLEKAVQDEYKRVYPKWEHPIRVTQTVPETFGGTLVVVNGKDDEGEIVDEMCFVFENDKVQVFSSTEQLAIFLDSRARLPWYQRIFATSILSGIVFLLSILLVFVAGIVPFISQTLWLLFWLSEVAGINSRAPGVPPKIARRRRRIGAAQTV